MRCIGIGLGCAPRPSSKRPTASIGRPSMPFWMTVLGLHAGGQPGPEVSIAIRLTSGRVLHDELVPVQGAACGRHPSCLQVLVMVSRNGLPPCPT